MSDKITTLHLKNDPSTNVYPNVKIENIPLDVTITRDGENLAKTKTIYKFTTSRFLSLGGGEMEGDIKTGGFLTPEKSVLGDGLDVIEESNPANPATHYGCGYICQDDDEDTSVKYKYNFPKKSGTFALEEDLENYAKKEDYPTYGDISEFIPNDTADIVNSSSGYYEIKNKTIRICGYIKATAHEQSNQIFFKFDLPSAVGVNIPISAGAFIAGAMNGSILLSTTSGVVISATYLYKYSDTLFAIRFNNSYTLQGIYTFDLILPYNA